MIYMMEWKMKDGCVEKCVDAFLNTGAPMPDGLTQLGRWHAPGSGNGWLIVETDDVKTVYIHASEWAEYLHWNVTPVVADDVAGEGCKAAWKK